MPIRLSQFEMPDAIVKDENLSSVEKALGPNFGRYIAEPFEIGYARTIGNSLRRVLLSSIEGLAISAVRIQGAPHEFMAIPGVVEDVTDIILALKKVILRSPADSKNPEPIHIKREGPCVVTAGDLAVEGSVEVLNPEHPIATVGPDGKLDLEVYISSGRGFCPAEWEGGRQQEIGVIPIDRIYSPVSRVNFQVGHTRVGDRTDYESLVLEVTTDGRVTSDVALKSAAVILKKQLEVFEKIDNQEVMIAEPETDDDVDIRAELIRKLRMSVNDIELSVRAANCLNSASINTVGELVVKTENDMLKYRNFGKKSLNEIKDKLKELGMRLGMKDELDGRGIRYGIDYAEATKNKEGDGKGDDKDAEKSDGADAEKSDDAADEAADASADEKTDETADTADEKTSEKAAEAPAQ